MMVVAVESPGTAVPGLCGCSFRESMNPGEARSSCALLALLVCAALAGCTTDRAGVKQNLRADPIANRKPTDAAENYMVAFPDVLDVRIPNRPDLSGRF